uniref:Maestro heat-like repeat family member 1 n=1 Tax=Sparus aurata TaxID=8175 RepID=A0A671WUQ3_SPAAU
MDDTDVTLALLDAATDKDSEVQEQVRKSMLTLGKQQPDRVLAMCQDYLLKHPKLLVTHRVVILQTIELIVGCRIEEISYPKIKSIISLASDEMTRSKDVIPDWQQAASNILVAVGNKHINDIMEEILSKFQPGLLPHFFVVQTLANLSDSNVYGMVPFLNAILGTMLPMLNMAKQDNMKWVFSSALCHFSDSILEYLANLDKAPDPTVRKDTFSSEIYAAFDILFNNWLQSRESKLRLTVAEALGSMCHLMAGDKLEEQIPKLIPAILSLYKKNNEHYIISKSLCQVLDASVNMGSRVLETQLDSLLFALHQQIIILPLTVGLLLSLVFPVFFSCFFFSDSSCISHFNFFLSISTSPPLANSFPDRLVMFVLQKLENSNERSRVGSLAVLRHLINSTTSTMEGKKLLILASIRQPMADHSNKVKKRVVQVISAMAHHGYLELEGGELLVRFIVQNCALPDTYQVQFGLQFVTNEALRTMCDNTLHLLTTTVGRLADVLWPKLLYYLTPPQFSNATTPLCKSLIVLGNKKKSNQEPSFNIDFTQEGRRKIYSLEAFLSFPFRDRGHGAPSLSLLQTLSNNIHPNTETFWEKEIPPLLSILEGMKIYFLYQCIGMTLQQSFNKEVVRKQLQEVLLTARHNDAVEREGVAMGVGLCANSHLEGTLAKLDEFGKSDAFKKSPSIFNLLKERNDVEVEKVKSTLILCYGQVALNAPPEKILNRIDQDILRSISKHFNTKVLGIKVETKDLTMKLSLIQSVGLIAKAISECVKKQGYIFSRKQELITVMLDFIKAEPADSMRTPVRHLVMTTCANLMYPSPFADCFCVSFVQNMVSFHNLGALLGRLSPRCSDPHPAVRTAAIDCIYTLLYIQLRYEGFSLDYKDDAVDSLLPLKDRLENPDHSVLYKACSDLTKRLPQQQMTTLVFMLFEGLVDSQTNCCRASSVILNTLLKNRGGGLQELVAHTHTHCSLFSWFLPEKKLQKKMTLLCVGVHFSFQMTCGLKELLLNGQSQEPVVTLFPRLFSCLTVRLGASVGVSAPRDNNTKHTASHNLRFISADALRILLARAQLDEVMKRLDEDKAWDLIKEPNTHITGVTLLARAMSKHAGPRLPSIVECLCPSLNNIYECQRVTVTAFFSELLNHHVVTELMLIDVLMNNMMERISDPCCTVRMLSVRGLGNIAEGSPEKVHRHKQKCLCFSFLASGPLAGKLITLEAMSGLSKVLLYLDKKNVHLLVVYIFMKIKPFLESENDEIRCAAIHLMGNLSKFGSGEPVFKDQIHNVLVSLLLHLVDPNPQVVKACKFAMRVCAPVVGSEQITTMFQNHLHEDKSLHYGEFINDLTKYLVRHTLSNISMFFKSNWPEVRAGAAMFIGMTRLLAPNV